MKAQEHLVADDAAPDVGERRKPAPATTRSVRHGRVVVALGGNALLQRGQPMTIGSQREAVRLACESLASIAADSQLVVSHGNGPQIGLLALEESAYTDVEDSPLDVLGAETQGMIGYLIEQELVNQLPPERSVVALVTMIEVDPHDPAFSVPTKPIGPWYSVEDAGRLAAEKGWVFRASNGSSRRVVASPTPLRILEDQPIHDLLEHGTVVICAGGGGIPTAIGEDGRLVGVEAVIDKDLASALLATGLRADALILATDTPGAFLRFGEPDQQFIVGGHPDAILPRYAEDFGSGSMLPKIEAACSFARRSNRPAFVGSLDDIQNMLEGRAGTRISTDQVGVELTDNPTSRRRQQ